MRASAVCVAVLAASLVACGSEQALEVDGPWVGTITTEGNVTTVVNESGSVWKGPARLVEEASIGIASGPDEYMFGSITSLCASDERIYVADRQVPAVRVYDQEGTFLQTIGRPGQGPGEYDRPFLIATDATGRVFVFDSPTRRINVYGETGESVDTWPAQNLYCCAWPMYPLAQEATWSPVRGTREETDIRRPVGVQAIGPSGPVGEVRWIPEVDYNRSTFEVYGAVQETPFSAWLLWSPAHDGNIIFGASDAYRFEVLRPDGSKLIVERFWEPTPVHPDHREWSRRLEVALQREYMQPDYSWDGAEIPLTKPAFARLVHALSGEIWVFREGPSEHLADGVDDPLEVGIQDASANPGWRSKWIIDVFSPDGLYLGEVEVPPGIRPDGRRFFADDRMVVTVVENEAGTIMVKRYRLVLPGEE